MNFRCNFAIIHCFFCVATVTWPLTSSRLQKSPTKNSLIATRPSSITCSASYVHPKPPLLMKRMIRYFPPCNKVLAGKCIIINSSNYWFSPLAKEPKKCPLQKFRIFCKIYNVLYLQLILNQDTDYKIAIIIGTMPHAHQINPYFAKNNQVPGISCAFTAGRYILTRHQINDAPQNIRIISMISGPDINNDNTPSKHAKSKQYKLFFLKVFFPTNLICLHSGFYLVML